MRAKNDGFDGGRQEHTLVLDNCVVGWTLESHSFSNSGDQPRFSFWIPLLLRGLRVSDDFAGAQTVFAKVIIIVSVVSARTSNEWAL